MAGHADTIASLYAAFARGDVPAVLGAMAPDMRWTEAEGFPYGDTYKATGKSFRAPFVHVWKFRGDHVVSFTQHTDTVLMQRALQ